jgi:hypothetical protein
VTVVEDVGYSLLAVLALEGVEDPKGSVTARMTARTTSTASAPLVTRRRRVPSQRGSRLGGRSGVGVGLDMLG